MNLPPPMTWSIITVIITVLFAISGSMTLLILVKYLLQYIRIPYEGSRRLLPPHVALASVSYFIFQLRTWLSITGLLPQPEGWPLTMLGYITGVGFMVLSLLHLRMQQRKRS